MQAAQIFHVIFNFLNLPLHHLAVLQCTKSLLRVSIDAALHLKSPVSHLNCSVLQLQHQWAKIFTLSTCGAASQQCLNKYVFNKRRKCCLPKFMNINVKIGKLCSTGQDKLLTASSHHTIQPSKSRVCVEVKQQLFFLNFSFEPSI